MIEKKHIIKLLLAISLFAIIATFLTYILTKKSHLLEPQTVILDHKQFAKGIHNIPDDAFYSGNRIRGHWFLVESIHPHRNNAIISIYDAKSGDLIEKTGFNLICTSNNPQLIDNLEEEIQYYDGEKYIYLNSDCKLIKKQRYFDDSDFINFDASEFLRE